MPTRGRFVCHVHSLVHDGAVRLSPCGPTTKTSDEISIICLFRLILQANTLFYFILWYSSCFEFICSFHIFSSGFSTYGSVMIYYGIHSFIFVRMFIVKTICCNFYPLIQLVYLSIKILTDVTLFRMAPPKRQNPEPLPPPPPPRACKL